MNILFQNSKVVCPDGERTACLAVYDDIIGYIGAEPPADVVFDRIIDCTGKAILSGFYNGHTHSSMTLLRNYADGYPLQTWLFDKIIPIEDKMNGEDIYNGTCLAIMEMLSSGTVCFADMYSFTEDIARAVFESGIKANIGRGLVNFGDGDFSKDERLQENSRLFEQYHKANHGRIQVDFAPHSVYCCTEKYLAFVVETAQKYGTRLHIHVSETCKENEDCIQEHGKTPVQYLYDLGLFDLPCTAAHCVHVSDKDAQLLKQKGVTIAYNPSSNCKLGSGIAPIDAYLKLGLTICLGTDGAASNNNLNMMEEMHLASLLTCGLRQDPLAISAGDILNMATRNGAFAMGRPDCGLLQVGCKADFIVVDLQKPHLQPVHSVKDSMVYSAQAGDVEYTVVDGEILYEKGEFPTIDRDKVYYNLQKSVDRLFH